MLPKYYNMDENSNITEKIEKINWSNISWDGILHSLIDMMSKFAIRLVIAILIYVIGKWLINRLNNFFQKVLNKRDTDPSVKSFLKSFISITLTIVLIVIVIGILGIETSSLVALFASAGVAFGLALSGTLQNFAGGFIVLLFKPYRVGDFIESQGQSGNVREIQIFNTVLITPDNKVVYIPNGKIANDLITNYTKQETRRVDIIFNIAYGENYDQAKQVIKEIIDSDKRILKDPPYIIALHKLNQSSVDIVTRLWTKKEDYWDVYFALNESVYKRFSEKGIDIPFPQLTVHMAKNKQEL